MKFRALIASALAVFALALVWDSNIEGGDKKEPVSIKVVMKKAMAGGLCKKVATGKASDEEKAQLIALFTDLAANKCPKGDEDGWKTRTQALLKAVKSDDVGALKKAADCKGCHSEHK